MLNLKRMFQLAKIGRREKAWAILWVAVILTFLYFKTFHRPRALEIRDLRGQVDGLGRQKIAMLAKQPDLEAKKRAIETLKQEIGAAFEQLTEAEENLLDAQDVDELLKSLVKDRGKFELVLNSVRPVEQKEPSAVEPGKPQEGKPQAEPYKKLLVQMDLFGTFRGLVGYVEFLEQMRPYQEVQGIKVKVEGKEVSRPHAVIMASVLMGRTAEEKEQSRQEVFATLGEMAKREEKDPFLTSEKPKEVVSAVGLELSGILSEGGKPVAAMINNEIYSVGQVIQGKRIVAIEQNQVILEHGNRRFVLMAGQQREAAP